MQAQPTTNQNIESLLKVTDVAALLRLSVPHVRKQVRLGLLPAPFKLGGVKMWKNSTMQAFISELGGAA